MPKFMKSRAARANPDHYAELRKEQRRRYYGETSGMYHPHRWEPWEDELVWMRVEALQEQQRLQALQADGRISREDLERALADVWAPVTSDRALSHDLGRSMKSISNRRWRLKQQRQASA